MNDDMENDPILMRREAEAQAAKNKTLRGVMIGLAAVAVALAGVLAYVWAQKSSLVNDLEAEKQDLTEQMVALQKDYESLSSDYDSINSQLDTSRAEVAALIEQIQKTEATNRTKMRQYEKELGTLRSIMRGYITLNHQLTADAAAARREAEESRKANEELSQQVASLTGQVAAGSVIKARGIRLEAYNNSDKKTDRSSRTVRLLTTLSLVENELAPKGPVRVYIRVKDPEGVILTNANRSQFTLNGESLVASASREVDYEGNEVEMSIYLNDIPSYTKGIYTVEAYTEQALLGTAELMLR